jgi:hypothetical protein
MSASKASSSFLKKEPKNICSWCRARMVQNTPRGGGGRKSFCFFFLKQRFLEHEAFMAGRLRN